MKLEILSIIFLFNLINISGQNITYIYDKETNLPISYASISYNDGGFYTNSNGSFNTNLIPDKTDTIKISILGYKNLSIHRYEIPDTIFLQPKVNKLNEVTIIDYKKEISIKPQKNILIDHQSWPLKNYNELCTCLYPKKYADARIDKIIFRFKHHKWSKNFTDNVRAILKFNVYEGSDTLFKNKIYQTKEFKIENKNVDLDVNFGKSDTYFSKEGVCIGIEMIGLSKDGFLLDKSSSVRPKLHKEESKYYDQKTYIKFVFNDTISAIPIIDFINKGRMRNKPYKRRNLSLGLKLKY
ncbi:carboxypeptidase-like regulatory domain-containing protein [Mesohalobacter halotolerans]|uniref:Carboxypeptidase-like regulatory domain-containing protein n=1 Tax=Mesohalobacter halotolerans TaxID=1883405 RepID=A0A4U5TQ44_9FLAO|nr:carboxypeptidase-like regulatory domain-containing protein [Mesohalobacter halotolerans]TKS56136.1 carboxypeptidase-like regulatory domain-containing protein [Mesohalobacter halotolerans]